MKRVSYQAIFLDKESVKKLLEMQEEKLPKNPQNMHCTFKFNPTDKEIENFSIALLGKKASLKVIGYCSDGKNSGFQIELKPEQEEVYTNLHTVNVKGIPKVERTVPHITVSMSEDAKAVDTGFLKFKPIKEPFEISGMGGFFVVDKSEKTSDVIYEDLNTKRNTVQRETLIYR